MRRLIGSSLAAFLTLTAIASGEPRGALSVQQWRENIEFVAATLRDTHPDPFAYSSEPEFDAALADLKTRLPELEDHEAMVALSSAIASLNDGHTALRGGFRFLSGKYPIRFYAFADGVFVTAAAPDRQDLIGAQLIAIDGADARDAYWRVAAVTPHDNDMTIMARAPAFLSSPDVLHATGVAKRRDRAAFTLIRRDGSVRTYAFSPVSFDKKLVWTADESAEDPPVLRRSGAGNFWSRLISGDRILYVKVDRIRDGENETLAGFAADQARAERESEPRCVLLDLRDNGGGDGYLNAPLVDWAAHSPAAARENFFVAIGRNTFSAAQKLATALELQTDALFIGEPTGGRPNHYGDAIDYSLPHGGLTLSVSSAYWEDAGPDDKRDALAPDIPIAETSAPYFDWRDPVVDEIERRCK